MIAWQLKANKAVEARWASKETKAIVMRGAQVEIKLQRSLNRAQERVLEYRSMATLAKKAVEASWANKAIEST